MAPACRSICAAAARKSRRAICRRRSCRNGTDFCRKSSADAKHPLPRLSQDRRQRPLAQPRRSDMSVSADAVTWGYRFFFGREPESQEVIAAHLSARDATHLAQLLMSAPEFTSRKRHLALRLCTERPALAPLE